jgi:hypothetical protein
LKLKISFYLKYNLKSPSVRSAARAQRGGKGHNKNSPPGGVPADYG